VTVAKVARRVKLANLVNRARAIATADVVGEVEDVIASRNRAGQQLASMTKILRANLARVKMVVQPIAADVVAYQALAQSKNRQSLKMELSQQSKFVSLSGVRNEAMILKRRPQLASIKEDVVVTAIASIPVHSMAIDALQ
jgi:hypothetical protein